MKKDLLIAFNVSLLTLLFTGVLYPLFITEIASTLFPEKAAGSLIKNKQDRIIGSKLLSQHFTNPAYFSPRPAAQNLGYNGISSGGSNLAPTSKALIEQIQKRVSTLQKIGTTPIPIDFVTTSASGFDPHISIETALWQAPQVALHRNVDLKSVTALIERLSEGPQFYILGESRLNVLELNLALDALFNATEGAK